MTSRCCSFMLVAVLAAAWPIAAEDFDQRDPALKDARAFVEASDRYLHHSRLQRGMKGYGLTVFAGTTIEKFDVEIVSVMRNFEPGQDVILARCSGHGLEETMIIQGMSGSPVFVTDPRDGKDKMIGAIAYGWSLSKSPLGGIQPITQMLAMSGVLEDDDASASDNGQKTPGRRSAPAGASRIARDRRAFLQAVLDPRRQSLSKLYQPRHTADAETASPSLQPLATPLSISGIRPGLLAELRERLAPMGLVAVQAGGFGGVDEQALQDVKLQPGSSLAVPFITGDADWSGVGTVTEVIGEKVLGFGHAMAGEGEMQLPMATGYIHTVVPLLTSSFKLGASIRPVGTLSRDEYVGVGGTLGQPPAMIPMSITVDQAEDMRKRTFHYKLLDEWFYTGRLAEIITIYSGASLREPPLEHHVTYDIAVDFGELGTYRVQNRMGNFGLYLAAMDVSLPISALMYNPLGEPVKPQNIDVTMTIREGNIEADIIDARLDANLYQPGETLSGHVLVEPFRTDREKLPFTLKLPDDLPEGSYALLVGDAFSAAWADQSDQPQYYDPQTPAQLLGSIQRMVDYRYDRLYLHLRLPSGESLSLGQDALPDLPPSKAAILQETALPETYTIRDALKASQTCPYVLNGNRTLSFTVKKQTHEQPLRD